MIGHGPYARRESFLLKGEESLWSTFVIFINIYLVLSYIIQINLNLVYKVNNNQKKSKMISLETLTQNSVPSPNTLSSSILQMIQNKVHRKQHYLHLTDSFSGLYDGNFNKHGITTQIFQHQFLTCFQCSFLFQRKSLNLPQPLQTF